MAGHGQDDLVRALVDFSRDVFAENFIEDEAVMFEAIRVMVQSEDLMHVAESRYQVENLLADVGQIVAVPDDKPIHVVNVGLTPQEQSVLTASNTDFRLQFGEYPSMPHGLAYAQRLVDTRRLYSRVPPDVSHVIDIGGNWTMDVSVWGFTFTTHACNLIDEWREHHRQTYRHALLSEVGAPMTYCKDGVEQCQEQAKWFVSIHALPCIDPAKWPHIFKEHSFGGGEAVFHYEPGLDSAAIRGYIPEACMHWRQLDNEVEFFFEGDSSLSYSHRRDWLRQYARPQYFTEPDWDKVIHYTIVAEIGGVIHSRFELLEKHTIGNVTPQPVFRWVGGDDVVVVTVPKFDPSSGGSVDNPLAYKPVRLSVPLAMYEFAYHRGLANDTMRPDNPLSREAIYGAVRSYNQSFLWNNINLTDVSRLPTSVIDDIATGIYIAVVYRASMNKLRLGGLTKQMLRMQRRWGSASLLGLVAQSLSYTALSPFIMLSTTFQEAIDLVSLSLQSFRGVIDGYVAPTIPSPVLQLDSVPGLVGRSNPLELPTENDPTDRGDRVRNFYAAFRADMPDELRIQLERDYFDGKPPPPLQTQNMQFVDGVVLPPLRDAESIGIDIESVDNELSDTGLQNVNDMDYIADVDDAITYYSDRDKWREHYAQLHDGVVPSWAYDEQVECVVGNDDDVFRFARESVYEFALYCFDVHYSAIESAREFLRSHFVDGVPNLQAVHTDNITKEVDARFFEIRDNVVVDLGVEYASSMMLDPFNGQPVQVNQVHGQFKAGPTTGDLLYTIKSLRIMNGATIGAVAAKAVQDGLNLKGVKFELHDGIPGSGKTKVMVSAMTMDDVYVTGPRAPMEAVAKWLGSTLFKGKKKLLERRVRTIDSVLMWGVPRCKTLFLDEVKMQHGGVPFLLAHITKAERVVASGDTCQLPFIDLSSRYIQIAFAHMKYWHSIQERNLSERMPQDVTRLIRQYYPLRRRELIKTTSPIERSISVEVVNSKDDIRYYTSRPYETWICVLQGDKADQIRKPGFRDGKIGKDQVIGDMDPVRPVLTVHEAQGDTYPVTVLYRLSTFTNAIFASLPHQIVAMSRHTIRLVYRTVVHHDADPMARELQKAIEFTAEQLQAVAVDGDNDYVIARLELADRVTTELGV